MTRIAAPQRSIPAGARIAHCCAIRRASRGRSQATVELPPAWLQLLHVIGSCPRKVAKCARQEVAPVYAQPDDGVAQTPRVIRSDEALGRQKLRDPADG